MNYLTCTLFHVSTKHGTFPDSCLVLRKISPVKNETTLNDDNDGKQIFVKYNLILKITHFVGNIQSFHACCHFELECKHTHIEISISLKIPKPQSDTCECSFKYLFINPISFM